MVTSITGGSTNTQIPTALAVWNAITAGFATNDALVYKGAINASTNPNYPAADAGHVYKISVAGKIGGASGVNVTAGDTLYCNVDSTAAGDHATVGANWTVVQANVDAATLTTLGLVQLASNAEALAQTDTNKAVTPSALVGFTRVFSALIGDGTTTSISVTDNFPINKQAIVRDATSNKQIFVDTQYAANTTTFIFDVAPTTNQYRVVIEG